MKNYKWETKKDVSTRLDDFGEAKMMGNTNQIKVLSPKECYQWIQKKEDLRLEIVEVNSNSSESYGDQLGRYFFIEEGAERLVAVMFMQYAYDEVAGHFASKPEMRVCSEHSITEDGITYKLKTDDEIEQWNKKMCSVYIKFVKSIPSSERYELQSFLNPRIVYNLKYAYPTGKTFRIEVSRDMTYGEFKKMMINTVHIRPWAIKIGWKRKSQEEKDSTLLSKMRVRNGIIVVAEDATINELNIRFQNECNLFMRWRYAKRQWQKIPPEVRLNEVDNLPNFWWSLLARLIDY